MIQLVSQLESDAKQAFDSRLADYHAELEDYKAEKEALKSAMLNTKKQALKNKPVNHDAITLKNQFAQLNPFDLCGSATKPMMRRLKNSANY